MNVETFEAPVIDASQYGLVLATDLDGTFLGGSEEERLDLYRKLEARDDVLLIFVTGRDVDFIRELVAQPHMPVPRFIVGDVGTSVYDVAADFAPVHALEAEVKALWNDANEAVMGMLDGEPGLELQVKANPFRHRVSYFYKPDELREETVRKIEEAGFDCLTSDNLYLDVLPKGVAKGPTLRRMVDTFALPQDRVLAAGDTMNDLSMLDCGLKAVAVGNSEDRLLAALPEMPHIYRSRGHGCAGILEAIHHFNLTPK
jgi:HAD superfamily hydrolase (TIGR01484 family)